MVLKYSMKYGMGLREEGYCILYEPPKMKGGEEKWPLHRSEKGVAMGREGWHK